MTATERTKKNALRHSYISYRVTECADVARVADESGKSPAIIKATYLKRVKPDAAKDGFSIRPTSKRSRKIITLATSAKHQKRQTKTAAMQQAAHGAHA